MELNISPFRFWFVLVLASGLAQLPARSATEDTLRLDARIRPVTQALELDLDPSADGYRGVARVELRFEIETNAFWFHALEIELGKATLDGEELILKTGEAGMVSAKAKEPVKPGVHVFEVAFTNDFNRDGTGLYKAVTGEKAYLFTQMEPIDARRAFPCWDEPNFKNPWRLRVTIPKGVEAIGNMPIAQTVEDGARRILEFGQSPPMPAYLVLIAVGPFDFLPIPAQPVPGRIVTVAGKKALGQVAADEAPALLTALERYFEIPFPYAKLDHVAVPEFNWGGMENAGAITYRDASLLYNAKNMSIGARRGLVELIAHEMAHMWFGDLVTMQWWDDLWLNEAFATWVSFKVGREVHPEMKYELMSFQSISGARANDTQPSVKPIRRPFKGGDNINEAFDTLSYEKGQAILSMIEGWIGETKFQSGLRSYFSKHAWGNTRAEDLWAAFADAGDSSLQETLRRYLEQPGIPELSFKPLPGDRLEVSQRRYRIMTAKGIAEQVWQVPIVMRFGKDSGEKTVRLLLKKECDTFSVPGLDQAEWIYPNSGESGYYFWHLPTELTSTLIKSARGRLSTIERLGLLERAQNAMMAGNLRPDQLLELAGTFGDDPEQEVRKAVAGVFSGVRNLLPTNERQGYANVLRKTLRPMLDSIGFEPKEGETAELQDQRSLLLSVLGIEGEDQEVTAFCRAAATRQIEDPRNVNPSITGVTLSVATWNGDAAWWEQLRTAFEKAEDPDVRARFLARITGSRDPELVRRGLDYTLTEAVRPTEFTRLLFGRPELAALRFEWLVANYEGAKKKMASQFWPFLVSVLYGGDLELLAKGRAFFLDPTRKDALTELRVREVGDAIELESALRERYGQDLVKLAKAWAAEPVAP